jgi:hypothetical protein
MRLIDDIGLAEPLSEDSLTSDFDGVDLSAIKGRTNAKNREEINSTPDTIFDFGTSLNKKK